MSPSLQNLGIDRLSIAERISLVQEILDSISAESEGSPLSESQRQEVDRRNPGDEPGRDQWRQRNLPDNQGRSRR